MHLDCYTSSQVLLHYKILLNTTKDYDYNIVKQYNRKLRKQKHKQSQPAKNCEKSNHASPLQNSTLQTARQTSKLQKTMRAPKIINYCEKRNKKVETRPPCVSNVNFSQSKSSRSIRSVNSAYRPVTLFHSTKRSILRGKTKKISPPTLYELCFHKSCPPDNNKAKTKHNKKNKRASRLQARKKKHASPLQSSQTALRTTNSTLRTL